MAANGINRENLVNGLLAQPPLSVLRGEGQSLRQIAENLGVGYGTVRENCCTAALSRRIDIQNFGSAQA